MDWILSIVMIITNYLLSKKMKWGWVLLFLANLLWIYYALNLNPPQYGLIPATIINLLISINGIIVWFDVDIKKQIIKFRDFLQNIYGSLEYKDL